MLRREHHVGRAKERIRPGGVDGDPVAGGGIEDHLRTGGFADPVALHLLDAFRPVEIVEVVEQPLGVFGNPQHPLLHRAALHRMVAAFTAPVDHLFVGEHGSERRAPVDRHLVEVGQPLLVKLHEDPLGPLEVVRIGGVDLAIPVIAEAERLDLTAEVVDVLLRGHRRMGSSLHGVLFRGQPERIPPHRMKHVEVAHPLVAAEDVGRGVPLGMADVQPRPGGIGEHIQRVEFRPFVKIDRPERVVLLPVLLPFLFNRGKIVFACHIPPVLR